MRSSIGTTGGLVLALLALAAAPAQAGQLQLAVTGGYDSGGRGDSDPAFGPGVEAGYFAASGLGLFAAAEIVGVGAGDADPVMLIQVQPRYRRWLGDQARPMRLYVAAGLGLGPVLVAGRVDDLGVPGLLELGLEVDCGPLALGAALQEQPMLLIGDGNPATAFVNQIGAALSLRF